jgi:uncharacterized membrane protein
VLESKCRNMLTSRNIAGVYFLFGLTAVMFLSINIPPFQNADEPAHFGRAMQIAEGKIIGRRYVNIDGNGNKTLSAGAKIDPAILEAFQPFAALMFHPEVKANRSLWAANAHWTNKTKWFGFPNTQLYPPLFYLPSVAGVLLGRAADLTVVQTLLLSRMLTGIAATSVGAAAIACAGPATIWMFAILTLPMSLALFASTSQDALMLACGALAGSLFSRLFESSFERNGRGLIWLALLLALIVMARPPYCAIALLPLAVPRVTWQARIMATAGILVSVMAWSLLMSATVYIKGLAYSDADPAAQIAFLLADPSRIFQVAWATFGQWRIYTNSFIGQLGWLDTPLPSWYYEMAWIMLGGAALATMSRERASGPPLLGTLIMSLALIGSVAGVFGSLYVISTDPGSPVVIGVSGRYFLPLVLIGAALLPAFGTSRTHAVRVGLTIPILLFPAITLCVVMRTVVLRYYLS